MSTDRGDLSAARRLAGALIAEESKARGADVASDPLAGRWASFRQE